ncbi:AMP-binding protein [Candidatus Amarolinea dominans]|uniref:LpxL/LpxP family acyltransferase n=1 Tax=Candidatus Amarolinea dominans TaxID=3140696 RepID=UPI001D6F6E82|nr:AMP-binding protein [Anaerolineae bacterium]
MAAPEADTLVDVLRWRAARQPDRPAYIYLTDGETEEQRLTYSQLDRQARQVAAALQCVAQPGDRVLVPFPSDLAFMAAFLGCLYAGMIAVPAHPPALQRAGRPATRLQWIVQDAGATVALAAPEVIATLDRRIGQTPGLAALHWLDLQQALAEPGPPWQPRPLTPQMIAFLQYTSGSTTDPKGVMIPHSSILANARCLQSVWEQDETTVVVNWMPLQHDGGLIGMALQAIFIGAPCVLLSPTDFLQNPVRWLQAISRFRGHTSAAPNFAYDLCAQKITPAQKAGLDLSSWQVAVNSAEPVRAETLARFDAAFEPCGFRPQNFYHAYGLAEATLFVAGSRKATAPSIFTFDPRGLEQQQVRPATGVDGYALVGCGRPLSAPDVELVIAQPEQRILCGPDTIGEIWFRSPSVAAGYWNRPDETQHTFGATLADSGAGPFLRTGDLGFWHAGELMILGRIKDLIIVQGRNFYPQDIELTVAASHAALQTDSCAAFGVTVAGQERLVIVQELRREFRKRQDQADEIVRAIRLAVARQHGILAYSIALIAPLSLPKTSSGKVQHQTTRRLYLDGALETVAAWTAPPPTAAAADLSRAAVELTLQELFQAVLGAAVPDRNTSFFDLGGDSLALVELHVLIEEHLQRTVPAQTLLQTPSVAGMAQALVSAEPGEPPAAKPVLEKTALSTPPRPRVHTILARPDLSTRQKISALAQALMRGGPQAVGSRLPYATGARFLAWLSGQTWLQQRAFQPQVALLRRCLALLDQPVAAKAVIRLSLCSNLWHAWRLAALAQATPAVFDAYVQVQGLEILAAAQAQGRGVIILNRHAALSTLSLLILARQGADDLMIVGRGGAKLDLLGLHRYKGRFLVDDESQRVDEKVGLAAQMVVGLQTLNRGGVLSIAADGYQVSQALTLPFYGRQRPFGVGFAELAVRSGAAVIPVFVTLSLSGHVQMQCTEPLTPQGQMADERVRSLVQQYAAQYAAAWPHDLGNFYWGHLSKYLALPEIALLPAQIASMQDQADVIARRLCSSSKCSHPCDWPAPGRPGGRDASRRDT